MFLYPSGRVIKAGQQLALVLWKYRHGTLTLTCSDKPLENAFNNEPGRGGAQGNSDTGFLSADHHCYSAVSAGPDPRCPFEASKDAGQDSNHSQTTADKNN